MSTGDMNTATVGRRLSEWEEKRSEAASARRRDARNAAVVAFERTAAELAGPDETLRRVLLARLVDAYHQGSKDEWSNDHYYTFGWAEEQRELCARQRLSSVAGPR